MDTFLWETVPALSPEGHQVDRRHSRRENNLDCRRMGLFRTFLGVARAKEDEEKWFEGQAGARSVRDLGAKIRNWT
jgi:hypothetical protein